MDGAHAHCEHAHDRVRPDRRAGALIVAVGALPFLLGHLISPGTTGECPVLQATGLPCPGCGAARAFEQLGHGSASFLDYNWLWLVVAAATIVYGVVVAARGIQGRPPPGATLRERPWLIVAAAATLAIAAWLVALSNLGTIRG